MYELSIKDTIAAAHYLREYKGKCESLHGHTYTIEVTIKAEQLGSIGMVYDFTELKKKLKDFLLTLDHTCLNDLDYFKDNNPTTELIAKYVYENYGKLIDPLKVKKVQVWESDTSSVTYYD